MIRNNADNTTINSNKIDLLEEFVDITHPPPPEDSVTLSTITVTVV